jgi:hypothetical protein
MGINKHEAELVDRLDQILKILSMVLVRTYEEGTSLTDKAIILKRAGLDNYVIAEILNSTAESIRKLTANYNRPEKKKGAKK